MTGPVTIRPARPDEARRLTEIATAAKRHWGYPEAWLAAWRDGLTFTPAFVAAHRVWVAVDGVPVACSALVGTELEHLWVEPSQMGRGIGRALFEHAAQAARDGGETDVWITSDPHAEAFYLRMGAERVGHVRADVCGERRALPRLRLALRAAPESR